MNHTIIINKKRMGVPALVFLCHMVGGFKYLQSYDTYVDFFINFKFKDKDQLIYYLSLYIHSQHIREEFNRTTLVNCLKSNRLGVFKEVLYKEGSLLYVYVLIQYYRYLIPWTAPNAQYLKKFNYALHLIEVINNITTYSFPNLSSDNYFSLQPLILFYKRLALLSRFDYIDIEILDNVIKEFNPSLTYEDIKEDLLNGLIILPYKYYYVWSNEITYNYLLSISLPLIHTYCIDWELKQKKNIDIVY